MLEPPEILFYEEFINETVDSDDVSEVEKYLQQATDAFWVVTGVDVYPEDPRGLRLAYNAIFDLSLWLKSQAEHRDEINSPFSGERIGSYSYSKMQSAVRAGEGTGLYWLDLFAMWLRSSSDDGLSWLTSENVFNPGGLTFAEREQNEDLGYVARVYTYGGQPEQGGVDGGEP